MERLTQKSINYCAEICRAQDCETYHGVRNDVCGDAAIYNRLAAYEDTGLEPEEVEHTKNALAGKSLAEIKEINGLSVQRMIELAQAEQEGRLVVLPCKVGDTVWGVVYDTRDCPTCVGIGGCFGCSKANPIDVYRTDFKLHMVEEIGRTLFLTRAEAEAAMEGENT